MRLCALISMACVLTALGAVQPEPGFDPKEVVRQVHSRTDVSVSRSGGAARVPGSRSYGVPSRPTNEGRSLPAVDGGQFGSGAEFLLDTNSMLVPAPGGQFNPAISFDGTNFLVVWEDQRSDGYSDIRGARVTPEGVLLDMSGFAISQGADDQLWPAVGFDGTNFLVVWQDHRHIWNSDIYGARVTPAGTVLDPQGVVISEAPGDEGRPDLGFDGDNFLVVWQDDRDNPDEPDIYGARFTPGGEVLDSSGFVIVQAAYGQYTPVLGFGGENFFVAWQDSRDSGTACMYGTLVTPQGEVVVPDGFPLTLVPGLQGTPAMGFDGTNFLLAWQDVQGSFPPSLSIYAARVTPGGMVLDPDGIVIAGGNVTVPAVGIDGANFLVSWQNGTSAADISGARVTPDGQVLDSPGFAISRGPGLQGSPAVAFDGANSLVVWHDHRSNPALPDIYGARVTPDGAVLDSSGFIITLAARDQFTPAVAFDGVNFLVAWEDHRSGSYSDIYGARVTPGGEVLDPDGLVISQATNWQYSPALAFDGTNFLAVWHDNRGGSNSDIYGARVTPDGIVLDPDGIAISPAARSQRAPTLAFDGTNFMVVWQDDRAGNYNFDIYGARVTPGGAVLDPEGVAISQASRDQELPAVGFDGANFLVVWQDYRGGEYSDIYGARVTPQGSVVDPSGFVLSQAALNQAAPVIGYDSANFLVVWTDYRSGIYPDIFGTRVTPKGSVLDPTGLKIARAAKGQYGPALGLGFDGTNFLVVWEDYRTERPDIFGALVTPAGVVIDSGMIVNQEGNQLHPSLARGDSSDMLLVYQGWAGTIGDKTYNTDRIWGKMNPSITGIEESPQPIAHGSRSLATVVRGVLFLPRSLDPSIPRSLVDISGRNVLDLSPGANDVSGLAPGVYFVHQASSVERDASSVMKVVVQR